MHSDSGSFYTTEILRLTSRFSLYLPIPLCSSPSFLLPHPSIPSRTPLRLLSTNTLIHYQSTTPAHYYNKDLSTTKVFHPTTNAIRITQINENKAIMSDASDSTFTAGETKLLISIMKNLTGDLQVRLLCFSCFASVFPAISFHITTFDCILIPNHDVRLPFHLECDDSSRFSSSLFRSRLACSRSPDIAPHLRCLISHIPTYAPF